MASLACTSCRARKQRCDRTLPSCMPCVNSQQLCQYPDQHKRGLPAGFLNAMESRLRETELALFYALSELHEGAIEQRAYAGLSIPAVGLSSPQNKSDMMEKWANLPLGDRTQVKEWFLNQRAEGSSSPAAQVNVQSRAQTYPVVTPTPRSGDRTPESHPQRQVSAFPRPPVVVECHPQSQELDTFATTTTGPPSTPMAPVSDLNAPANGSGLSVRVQTIVESHRRLYF